LIFSRVFCVHSENMKKERQEKEGVKGGEIDEYMSCSNFYA